MTHASAKPVRAARPNRGGRRAGYVAAIFGGALAVTASGVAVALAIWLAPSLVARGTDDTPGRPKARAMALFGVAACLADAWAIWSLGGDFTLGLAHALDPLAVARSWAAQGGGWLLAEIIPVFLTLHGEWQAARDLDRLRRARAALADDWRHD